jgi:uncharacterized protein (DUF488 family)
MNPLYTIGHSTHEIDRFIQLLQMYSISVLCDVRSSPYSRYNPQFNRENIRADLMRRKIAYVYLGRELGPQSEDPATCHRTILICRTLRNLPLDIFHIREDGSLEKHADLERRLLKILKIPERQLFETPEDLIQNAYRIQGEKIAFSKKSSREEEGANPS